MHTALATNEIADCQTAQVLRGLVQLPSINQTSHSICVVGYDCVLCSDLCHSHPCKVAAPCMALCSTALWMEEVLCIHPCSKVLCNSTAVLRRQAPLIKITVDTVLQQE